MEQTHAHAHAHAPGINKANINVFVAGIALNFAFVITEVIAGFVYHSMALLTDAGHNLGDVAGLVVSLIAFWVARKRSTARFTYGFKKTTVLAALANAVVLLLAVGVLGYEALLRLLHPQPVEGSVIAWVAGLGIIINGVSAFLFFRQKRELNSKAAYLHLLSDALVSLGVVVAGIVIFYTRLFWLDPAIGIVIMIAIVISTWGLLRDSFNMTIDAVPSGIDLENIKKVIGDVRSVTSVHHVHVWPLSTLENALTAHVVISDNLLFEEKLEVVKEIKHELLHHNIQHSTIEISKADR